jgi:DNA-binding NtrC family response regulator
MEALGLWLETRVRRGRVAGIEESLEGWCRFAETQSAHALSVDPVALMARLALARGQAHAALERCDRGLERGAGSRPERVAVLEALAARALGWLGRGDEAFGRLALGGEAGLTALEPEERIAVLAHAGRRDSAFASCDGSVLGGLWADVLAGRSVAAERWADLRRLDRYRAGRAIHDLGLVDSSVVPVYWRRRGASDLRRFGAGLLAERIEALESSAWSALESFVLAGVVDIGAVGLLLARAGYGEARVELGVDPVRVLNAGVGGAEELVAETPAGRLAMRAPILDAALRGLFAAIIGGLRTAKTDEPTPPDGGPRAEERTTFRGVVGDSESLSGALSKAAALAIGEMPVLVRGETGTGKELLARGIHEHSRRRANPFLAINCAALSESLLLSDLFGHVRGAFTGADRDRSGVFEAGRGGTVFLDEIGDLPLTAQGMLLRVLQEKEVRRVGESLPRRVDVRVVAATHRDLSRMVSAGTFRQDLFYRLAVAVVELPPLRDRGDDVILLAQDFLQRHAPDRRLSTRARAQLLGHRWPGNVRELENVLAVAAALSDGVIEPHHLEIPASSVLGGVRGDYHQQVDGFRRRLVEEALSASGGNRAEAARRLGLSRQALSYLSQQMGLARRR